MHSGRRGICTVASGDWIDLNSSFFFFFLTAEVELRRDHIGFFPLTLNFLLLKSGSVLRLETVLAGLFFPSSYFIAPLN